MAELKRCPFCGGEATIATGDGVNGYDLYFPECQTCGATFNIGSFNEEDAASLWNRRASEEHWLDNADSYICPVCGFETDSPAKYDGCKCPKCGFQDRKDADNG